MSKDLINRLRYDGNSWAQKLFNEAADAIEQAWIERDIARQDHLDSCRLARERLERIHDLEADIDRLRRRP